MTHPDGAKLEIFADADALARHAASWLLAAAGAAPGRFAICLSGGSTPQRLYRLLGDAPFRDRFPWPRVHWFWGDERFVPHDDPRSNYRMVREALLSRAPIPPANIHAMPTEGLSPDAAALAYARELRDFYGADALDPERPLFDVNLIGLGPDGHTASLFPANPVLQERTRWVAPVTGGAPEARLTLTYPVLESSRQTAFLVAGAEKRAILARLRHGDEALPAARVHPVGSLAIFADQAACGAS